MYLDVNPSNLHNQIEHELHLMFQFIQLMETELASALDEKGQTELLKESASADVSLQRAQMHIGTLVALVKNLYEQRDEAIRRGTKKAYQKLEQRLLSGMVDTIDISEVDAAFLVRVITGNEELPEGLSSARVLHELRQLIEDRNYITTDEQTLIEQYEENWSAAS